MNRLATQIAFTLLLVAALARGASAQAAGNQNTSGAVPAATGLDTTTQMSENPPLSGLDEPRFEPGYGARSYLAPKAELSESVDSNGASDFSKTNITTTTRALGSVELQKLWKMHPLAIDYVGGIDSYNGPRSRFYQVHSLAATQRFLWRTGQFALRDSFSYLPEGAFGFGSFGGSGGAYGGGGGGVGGGGLGGGGITGGTGGGSFNNGQFGSVGTQPRITNMGIADVTQYLSPRSSVVLSAGYGLTHFLGNPQTSSCASTVSCYFNSQETILQAGYNRQISRQNQVGVVYAFEELHFPTSSAGSLNVNLVQFLFGHRISGKLDFLVGGGPEWVHRSQSEEELVTPIGTFPTGLPCLHTTRLTPCVVVNSSFVTGSARASLRYHWSARTELVATYLRYISPGSGFFGGANTDVLRFAVSHSLARRWTVTADTGYSRSSRLLAATASVAGGSANYHYWYVGGGIHRQLGRYFGAFASYQYSAFDFGSNGCTGTASLCGRSYGRNVGLIGLHWTPHPIRLD